MRNFENEYDETNEKLKHEMEKIFETPNYQILSNHKWNIQFPKILSRRQFTCHKSKDFLGLCGDIFTNGRFDEAITSGLSIADKFLKNEL